MSDLKVGTKYKIIRYAIWMHAYNVYPDTVLTLDCIEKDGVHKYYSENGNIYLDPTRLKQVENNSTYKTQLCRGAVPTYSDQLSCYVWVRLMCLGRYNYTEYTERKLTLEEIQEMLDESK